jgi:hypothetical protein
MQIKIQIKSNLGTVLFEFEKENNTIRDTLIEAVRRGAPLFGVNLSGADLSGSNLFGASLFGANLSSADLSGSNLSGANLSGASLLGANLSGANLLKVNLSGANLLGVNLSRAKNAPAVWCSALSILKSQKNKLIAYKYVTEKLTSPEKGNLSYKIGKTVILNKKDCDYSDMEGHSKGLNVATLEWCIRNRDTDSRPIIFGKPLIHDPIIEVEYDPKDIVSIPYASDGKFRVRKLKVLRVLDEKEVKKVSERKIK